MIGLLRAVGRALLATPRRRAWVPVLLWLGLITWLSSRPAGDLERLGWSELLVNLGHAPLFGLLALWMALVLPRREGWPRIDRAGARNVLLWVLLCGALDELHQYLGSRGRSFSLLDVITDLTGAACVLWVAAYVGRTDAEPGGLLARLAGGVVACTLAAALATWGPDWLPVH